MKKKTKVSSDHIRNFFIWVEQYAGCSYDVSEDLDRLKEDNKLYFDPIEWYCEIISIVEILEEVDDILKKAVFYPNDGSLPSRRRMAKEYTDWVEDELNEVINNVKKQLHLQEYNYNNTDEMIADVQIIRDLINITNENTVEDIIKRDLINNYDKLHGYMLSERLGVRQKSFSGIYTTIKELRTVYFDTLIE